MDGGSYLPHGRGRLDTFPRVTADGEGHTGWTMRWGRSRARWPQAPCFTQRADSAGQLLPRGKQSPGCLPPPLARMGSGYGRLLPPPPPPHTRRSRTRRPHVTSAGGSRPISAATCAGTPPTSEGQVTTVAGREGGTVHICPVSRRLVERSTTLGSDMPGRHPRNRGHRRPPPPSAGNALAPAGGTGVRAGARLPGAASPNP